MPVLQRGCVKSVQRGNKTISDMTGNTSTSINISPIDPNKSLLLLDIYTEGNSILELTSFNLLQSSIVITSTYNRSSSSITFTLSYQVVEFY